MPASWSTVRPREPESWELARPSRRSPGADGEVGVRRNRSNPWRAGGDGETSGES